MFLGNCYLIKMAFNEIPKTRKPLKIKYLRPKRTFTYQMEPNKILLAWPGKINNKGVRKLSSNEYWDEDDLADRMAWIHDQDSGRPLDDWDDEDDEDDEGSYIMDDCVTMGKLLDCLDTGDDENTVRIQVVFPGEDWESFDTLRVTSPLLMNVYESRVDCIGVEDGIIRVGLVA